MTKQLSQICMLAADGKWKQVLYQFCVVHRVTPKYICTMGIRRIEITDNSGKLIHSLFGAEPEKDFNEISRKVLYQLVLLNIV